MIEISVIENRDRDTLTIEIVDDGKGMDPGIAETASEPFYTTRMTRRVGLGLALLKEAAEQTNGSVLLESSPDRGTKVVAVFQLHHIDRKPLGNVGETILSLLTREERVDVVYVHQRDNSRFVFDSRTFRAHQQGMTLTSGPLLSTMRDFLNENEAAFIN